MSAAVNLRISLLPLTARVLLLFSRAFHVAFTAEFDVILALGFSTFYKQGPLRKMFEARGPAINLPLYLALQLVLWKRRRRQNDI